MKIGFILLAFPPAFQGDAAALLLLQPVANFFKRKFHPLPQDENIISFF